MKTSTLRDTQPTELEKRLAPITSRLWMLQGNAAPHPASRLAAGIVLAQQPLARGDEAKRPPIGVGVLLH